MSENKTKPTKQTVAAYLKTVDPKYTEDCKRLVEIMGTITGEKPKMWGPSIIGFGTYHYVYESGREGDFMVCGFSPRKAAISVYIMSGFEKEPELMEKLGKFKTGKSCLYIKSLGDVHVPTLKKLIASSVRFVRRKYPG